MKNGLVWAMVVTVLILIAANVVIVLIIDMGRTDAARQHIITNSLADISGDIAGLEAMLSEPEPDMALLQLKCSQIKQKFAELHATWHEHCSSHSKAKEIREQAKTD